MELCRLLGCLVENSTSNGHRGFYSDEISLGKLRAIESDGFIDIIDPHKESNAGGKNKNIAMARITEQGLKYHRKNCIPTPIGHI